MDIRALIWAELCNATYGMHYLVLYLNIERRSKKWFKIITLVCSAGGIFTAFKGLNEWTIFSMSVLGAVQIAGLIENLIFHSDKDIEVIYKLRGMYTKYAHDYDELYVCFDDSPEEDCKKKYFELRKYFQEIEDVDNSIYIKERKKLWAKAESLMLNDLNKYTNG